MHIGALCEEHQPDDQYVETSNPRPTHVFRIIENVHEEDLLILHPQNQDIARPICVCRALSPSNSEVIGEHTY